MPEQINSKSEDDAGQSMRDNRKPLKEINAGHIFSVQFSHFLQNSCVKWVASWAIVYVYVFLIQALGAFKGDNTLACLTEDV